MTKPINRFPESNLVAVLLAILWCPTLSFAALTAYPFGRSLDLGLLEKAASQPTIEAMVAEIRTQNIDIYKVTVEGVRTTGPHALHFLPEAPVILQTQFTQDVAKLGDTSIRGFAASPYDPTCPVRTQTILLAPYASAYHLLHEYAHVLLERALPVAKARENVALRNDQWRVDRMFTFNFEKLYGNLALASGPQGPAWRTGFVGYTEEYALKSAKFASALPAEEVIADAAVIAVLKKIRSAALTEPTRDLALKYMDANLRRISVRIDNVNFTIPWILSEIYGAEVSGDIPLREKADATQRLQKARATLRAIEPELGKLAAVKKQAEAR